MLLLQSLKDGRQGYVFESGRGQLVGLSEEMEFSMFREENQERTEQRYKIEALSEVVEFSMPDGARFEDVAEKALELYLAMCEENNIKPYSDYSGRVSLRISPHTHAFIALLAAEAEISLNKYLAEYFDEIF